MADEKKCPFCGSEKILLETPYVKLNRKGEYAPQVSYCCNAQKKNGEYQRKRFSPLDGKTPTPEEIETL